MFAICDEHANERAGEVPESVNSKWLDHSFFPALDEFPGLVAQHPFLVFEVEVTFIAK